MRLLGRVADFVIDYFWWIVFVAFIALSIPLLLNAYFALTRPVLLDVFWNPSLQMWEPVYATMHWWMWLLFPLAVLFYNPLHLVVPWAVCGALLLFWVYANRWWI